MKGRDGAVFWGPGPASPGRLLPLASEARPSAIDAVIVGKVGKATGRSDGVRGCNSVDSRMNFSARKPS